MDTTRLDRAMESGNYSTPQLLEIAATAAPSGNLRDLLLGAAKQLDRQSKQLAKALEVAAER